MPPSASIRALVVDADREAANRLARSLVRQHPELDLHPVGTVGAALDVLGRRSGGEREWDAVLCTVGRKHPEGLELVRRLCEGARRMPTLLIGEKEDIEAAIEGMKVGASDFLLRGPQLARHAGPRLRQAIDRMRTRRRQEMLLPALEAFPDTVLVADPQGLLLGASRACTTMFGLNEAELEGKPYEGLLDIGQGHPLPQEIRSLAPGAGLQREIQARRADGSVFEAHLTAVRSQGGEPLLLFTFKDITQGRELQEQLLQREKLSALGELISGVAHELNNPLTGVLGFSQLVMGHPDCPEKVRRDLRRIHEQAQRCERIVHNLLSFARKHRPEKRLLGVNGVLDSALALLDYQLHVENIRVVRDLETELPKTMADYHQLQQVFLNLINNARQAMVLAKKGGQLVVRTRSQDGWVRIEIADDGPGIPEELLPRIFDPFFTTKPKGIGTGLGLSLCYGMVSEHGGRIRARSRAGQGATFVVELPVRRSEAASEPPEAGAGKTPQPVSPRSVLVADDEEAIVELLYQVLSAEGHRVDTARSGDVALRKIENRDYDLLITDLRMPGCDGRRLCERWRSLHPERAGSVLLTTGDTLSDATRSFLEDSGVPHIEKPFDLKHLQDLIRSLLERTSPSPAGQEPEVAGSAAPAGERA